MLEKIKYWLVVLLAWEAFVAPAAEIVPRFKNVTGVTPLPVQRGECASPGGGTMPCLEIPVVVTFMAGDGNGGTREWTTSASYQVQDGLMDTVSNDFGAVASVVFRSLEPAVKHGLTNAEPKIRTAAARLLPRIHESRHYEVNAEVTMLFASEVKVMQVAEALRPLIHEPVLVTVCARSPATQAQIMYDRFKAGEDISGVYSNAAAFAPIKQAYADAAAEGKAGMETTLRMQAVIENQLRENVFISQHLWAGAVDLQIKELPTVGQLAVADVINKVPGVRFSREDAGVTVCHMDFIEAPKADLVKRPETPMNLRVLKPN